MTTRADGGERTGMVRSQWFWTFIIVLVDGSLDGSLNTCTIIYLRSDIVTAIYPIGA
jgi:hypothetical protein